jgi:hypothetical protein
MNLDSTEYEVDAADAEDLGLVPDARKKRQLRDTSSLMGSESAHGMCMGSCSMSMHGLSTCNCPQTGYHSAHCSILWDNDNDNNYYDGGGGFGPIAIA